MKRKLKKMTEDQKFAAIVQTSKDLFWKYGIKRVTIEEICREAGASKMTFYKHFRNKTEVVKVIIAKITMEAMEKYNAIMAQDIPFSEKISQSIHLKMEQTAEMSHEFFDDYYLHAEPELKEFLEEQIRSSLGLVYRDYVEAQKRGEIRQDIKPDFIIYFLNKMMEMVQDEHLESQYENPQDLIMEVTRFFFFGILPREMRIAKGDGE